MKALFGLKRTLLKNFQSFQAPGNLLKSTIRLWWLGSMTAWPYLPAINLAFLGSLGVG